MRKPRVLTALAVGVLAVGGAAGCAAAGSDQPSRQAAATSSPAAPAPATTAPATGGQVAEGAAPAAPATPAGRIDAGRAIEVARARAPGATVTKADLHTDDLGATTWEVDLTKQNLDYAVTLDAAGRVVGFERDVSDSSEQVTALARIGATRALQVAESRVPGATVTKADLDTDNGIATWKVELAKPSQEYKVTLDARTGVIVGFEQDVPGND